MVNSLGQVLSFHAISSSEYTLMLIIISNQTQKNKYPLEKYDFHGHLQFFPYQLAVCSQNRQVILRIPCGIVDDQQKTWS